MPLPPKKEANPLDGAPKVVTALVGLMDDLILVLKQEMDIVSYRRMTEHGALLKRKQKLAMDYRASLKAIAEQQEIVKKLPETLKKILKDKAGQLARTAEDNARAVLAAVSATQQLIQNIVSMVRTEVLAKPAYKNPAKAHLELGVYSPTCPSVAVSRSV